MRQERSAEKVMSTQASKGAEFSIENGINARKLESFGAAALSANAGEKNFINAESAMNFEHDRRNENLRQLEAFAAPTHIVDCYKRLSRAYSDIRNVKLRQDFNRSARDIHVTSNGEAAEHQLYFNFSDPDCYACETDNYEDDKFGTSYLEIGMGLGLDPLEVAKNPKLCATFMLARELGRAHDFERNYFEPQLFACKQRIDDQSEATSVALSKSLTAWSTARRNELSQRKHKNSRSNRNATNFALQYLSLHRDEFIYDMRKGEEANGRVQNLVNASLPIPIPDKLVRFASPDEGTKVVLNYCDSEGDIEGLYAITGRVDSMLGIDKPFMLNTARDENPNHGTVFKAVPNVEHVSFLPNRHADGKVLNDLLLDCGDDGSFLMQSSGEELSYTELNYGESKEYLSSVKKKFGNHINLLRRALNGARRSEHTDSLAFTGDLSAKDLVMGEALAFSPERNMRIHRVLRKWREYFVETKNADGSRSIYEIGDEKEA